MTTAQDTLLSAIREHCATSLCATLNEGTLKACATDALLRHGFAVVEGAGQKGKGRRVEFSTSRGIKTTIVDLPRVGFADEEKKWTSPDIRVVAPETLTVELQARSDFGATRAIFSANLLDDVQRILDGRADLFVLAADRPTYDALLGEKASPRGRKAKSPLLWPLIFPACDQLSSEFKDFSSVASLLPLASLAAKVPSDSGCDRIVIGLRKVTLGPDEKRDVAANALKEALATSGLVWR